MVEDVNQDVERNERQRLGEGGDDGSEVDKQITVALILCRPGQPYINEDRANKPEQVRNQLEDCCKDVQLDCLHADFALRLFATRDVDLVHSSSRTDQHH